jgi:hypothetical protein
MTKKNKIALLLMAPFFSVVVGGIIFGSYMVFTVAPWWALLVAVLISAVVGFSILTDEDNE